jgi:hypothetical protein
MHGTSHIKIINAKQVITLCKKALKVFGKIVTMVSVQGYAWKERTDCARPGYFLLFVFVVIKRIIKS